jgi:hypothetical protein
MRGGICDLSDGLCHYQVVYMAHLVYMAHQSPPVVVGTPGVLPQHAAAGGTASMKQVEAGERRRWVRGAAARRGIGTTPTVLVGACPSSVSVPILVTVLSVREDKGMAWLYVDQPKLLTHWCILLPTGVY